MSRKSQSISFGVGSVDVLITGVSVRLCALGCTEFVAFNVMAGGIVAVDVDIDADTDVVVL